MKAVLIGWPIHHSISPAMHNAALGKLGIGGGYYVSRRILARIDAVAETSRTIMAGDLSRRMALSGSDDEFDRLASSLNAMLERIERLMRGMKEVSDNINKALKTYRYDACQ